MTIEEAIEHCTQVALGCKLNGNNLKCAENHLQLGNWLKELKDLRIKYSKLQSEHELLKYKLNRYKRGIIY